MLLKFSRNIWLFSRGVTRSLFVLWIVQINCLVIDQKCVRDVVCGLSSPPKDTCHGTRYPRIFTLFVHLGWYEPVCPDNRRLVASLPSQPKEESRATNAWCHTDSDSVVQDLDTVVAQVEGHAHLRIQCPAACHGISNVPKIRALVLQSSGHSPSFGLDF